MLSGLTPMSRWDSSVNLREQESEHPLSILPIELTYIDFLIVQHGLLLTLAPLDIREHASLPLLEPLSPDLLTDLVKCLQEELLDI